MNQTSQSLDEKHIYGHDHPMVGKPCLFEGQPAVPYGSYILDGTPRLVVLILREGGHVYATSGIRPDNPDLVPLDQADFRARRVMHTLISGMLEQERKLIEEALHQPG